ncbi:DUF6053 domain-containing protein [Lysobacter enzymogenes]|uniref:DUF6053 domain-containing protein n=1 Tax=Lysobacter enzymogenes TaxID=69 RepID=UPI003850D369
MGGPSDPTLLSRIVATWDKSVGSEGPPTALWAAHLRVCGRTVPRPPARLRRPPSHAPRACAEIARGARHVFRCADLPPSPPLDTLPCSPSPSAPATLPLAGTRWRWTTSASAARGRTTSRTSISICRATS